MISNEERQEVMQELRRNVLRDQDVSMTAVIKALGVEFDGDESWGELCEAVWDRMCDLIDRPTCTMTECSIDHGSVSWGICCSRCNDEFEHAFHNEFSYCPNCGAEVIE